MNHNPPVLNTYTPVIRSVLPLLYAAWSDSVLTPSEAKTLQEKIGEIPNIDADEAELLSIWTDPRNPPNRQLFNEWELILIENAQKMPIQSRRSLVDLGLFMAQQSAGKDDLVSWKNPATKAALERLEEQLQLVNLETYQRIFPTIRETAKSTALFEAVLMNKTLESSRYELRQQVKRFFQDPVFHLKPIPNKTTYRKKILEWCHLMAEQGYGAAAFPDQYGGKGSMEDYIAIFETTGFFDLSLTIKFGVQFGLFGGSVYWLGTAKHHQKYLKSIGNLDLPGCFAMTETGHGSNVRGLETTATYDPEKDEIIVHSPNMNAGKEYIGNALHSRMASVFAQLIVNGESHGVHAILVPLRDENHQLLPGIKIKDNGYKMGLNGVDNGRIWFNQVRVPRENLLNRFGEITDEGTYGSPINNPSRRFFTMLGTLVGGRVCVPKAGLSAAKTGLTIAIRYGLKRRQFAPNSHTPETLLLDYPSHQRRLMPLLAKAYALNFALNYLADRYLHRSEENIREIETLAAGLKAWGTWFTTEALQECREACGGKGYLSENRFAALKADTDIFTTFEGDNTVLMQLVAKGVLTTFRESFHAEGMMGMLRFVGQRFSTNIFEMNPYTIRNTERGHLLSEEFHKAAFSYRVNQLTYSVGQRMRDLIKNGLSSYEAFLRCQTQLLALANAFVENIILEQFYAQLEKTDNAGIRYALKTLVQLYALHTIESHKGWYLEVGYVEGSKTKAIRREVDILCKKTRNMAKELTDSFMIPDKLLSAPIALNYEQ